MRPPIRQALAFHTLQSERGTLSIGDGASVVAEIKFRGVAAKMGFAHVMIGADVAALEDGEEILSGVGVIDAANILAA